MAHNISDEAEKILDKEFPVLDKGFVRLVDYMGNDNRIVQAARVSYGSGTKSFRQDKALINYLLRNEHTSPFEQVVFTFHIKLPIFVARQWIRHRTARLNEISGRYSIMKKEFYLPGENDIGFQSSDNKQGRSAEPVPENLKNELIQTLKEGQNRTYCEYEKIIDSDIARELARINLPLSMYTEWYWQMDLHNLFHFLRLRMDPHAQKEIRDYAAIIFEIIKTVCPVACEAFEEHIIFSVRFSRKEIKNLEALIKNKPQILNEKEQKVFFKKLNIKKY